jgi:hypothetical protein
VIRFWSLAHDRLAALIVGTLALVSWPVSEIFSCERYRLILAGPLFPLSPADRHVESGGSLSQEPSLSTFQLKRMLRELSRTSGRSGRNGECHSATSNGDGSGGILCSGQVLRASLHFGLRLLQDQLGLPARFQLMTSPSLLR